jgi:hypothetical protein
MTQWLCSAADLLGRIRGDSVSSRTCLGRTLSQKACRNQVRSDLGDALYVLLPHEANKRLRSLVSQSLCYRHKCQAEEMASLVVRGSRATALLESEARRRGDLELQIKQKRDRVLAEKFRRAQMRQVRRNAFALMGRSGDVPIYPSRGMTVTDAIHSSAILPVGAMEGPSYPFNMTAQGLWIGGGKVWNKGGSPLSTMS